MTDGLEVQRLSRIPQRAARRAAGRHARGRRARSSSSAGRAKCRTTAGARFRSSPTSRCSSSAAAGAAPSRPPATKSPSCSSTLDKTGKGDGTHGGGRPGQAGRRDRRPHRQLRGEAGDARRHRSAARVSRTDGRRAAAPIAARARAAARAAATRWPRAPTPSCSRNGDRLTGEVVQMRQGKLQVKTDDAGTLSIEWDKIASISTADRRDHAARRLASCSAACVPAARPARCRSMGIGGTAHRPPMAEIASFARIKTTFFHRIDGLVRSRRQLHEVERRRRSRGSTPTRSTGGPSRLRGSFSTNRRTSRDGRGHVALLAEDDLHPLSRQPTGWSRRWACSRATAIWGSRSAARATESIGRYLARTRHVEVLVGGGMAAGRETPVDAAAVTNVDALVDGQRCRSSPTTIRRPASTSRLLVVSQPRRSGPRAHERGTTSSSASCSRTSSSRSAATTRYDNRPKSASARQNDFGGSLSFGWSF